MIPTDDPELVELVAAITKVRGKSVLSVPEIIEAGPYSHSRLYTDINSEKLVTFMSSGRRFALVTDYARYLLLLKREGATAKRGRRKNMPRGPAKTPEFRFKEKLLGDRHDVGNELIVRREADGRLVVEIDFGNARRVSVGVPGDKVPDLVAATKRAGE